MVKAAELNDEVVRVRNALYYDLGVPFPGISLRFRDNLEQGTYFIMLHEVPMSSGRPFSNKVLVRETPHILDMTGIAYEQKDDTFFQAFLPCG